LDQQTGQFRIQRQVIREGLRRLPMRPVARWRLGVDTVNAPKGLMIADVSRNSPAYRYGLEPGDYLLDVMGYPVGFYGNGYYPLGDALNQLVRRDGWVNILIWNKRSNGEEAMWIQLEPRGQIGVPFRAPGSSNN
jgi:predicted metalloprotease with PDZ domain